MSDTCNYCGENTGTTAMYSDDLFFCTMEHETAYYLEESMDYQEALQEISDAIDAMPDDKDELIRQIRKVCHLLLEGG